MAFWLWPCKKKLLFWDFAQGQGSYNMCLKVNHVSGQMKKQNKTKIKQNKKHWEKEINL